MERIDFYTLEKPQGHPEWMLFARFENMPQQSWHGSKSLMKKVKPPVL